MKHLTGPSTTSHNKSPLLAALLSALICGLGQVYNGRPVLGATLFVLMFLVWAIGSLLGALTFGLGMIPFAVLGGALWLFSVVNAFAGSRRLNRV